MIKPVRVNRIRARVLMPPVEGAYRGTYVIKNHSAGNLRPWLHRDNYHPGFWLFHSPLTFMTTDGWGREWHNCVGAKRWMEDDAQ